jgi:hypothetical protein
VSLLSDLTTGFLELLMGGGGPADDREWLLLAALSGLCLACVSGWLVLSDPHPLREPSWGFAAVVGGIVLGSAGVILGGLTTPPDFLHDEGHAMSHKWRTCPLAVLLMGCLPLLCIDTAAQKLKPVVIDRIYTHYALPPPSLREMILAADAVVYGRIVAAEPLDTTSPVGGVFFRTIYRLKVQEILHALGGRSIDIDQLDIRREGGDRDKGTHIARSVQEGFPAFNIGTEYVLFLNWHASDQAWVPSWGPNGAFQLSGGRVDSPGFAKVVSAQKGKAAAQFLEEIRQFGKVN